MCDHESDQADAGKAVRHVREAPDLVGEIVRVAHDQTRADTRNHHEARDHRAESGEHDREMVETIAERILARLRSRHVVTELTHHLGLQLGNVFRADPDGPEVEKERRVHEMKED